MKTFPQLIFGYHGCELDVAERIVLGRDTLKASENSWDWLGTGAYFWEGAPDRARDWAKKHCKSPAVLGAVIDLGRCVPGRSSGLCGLEDIDDDARSDLRPQSRGGRGIFPAAISRI